MCVERAFRILLAMVLQHMLFSRKRLKHLAGDQGDTHVGLTSFESE